MELMFFPAAKRSATGAYLSAHSSTSRVLEYVPDSSIRVRTRDIPVVPGVLEYHERTYVRSKYPGYVQAAEGRSHVTRVI